VQTQAFFGRKKNEKSQRELDKEEAYRVQQGVLARRKNNSWQKGVEERRAEVRKYSSNPEYKAKIDLERRERKKRDNPDPPVSPFSIIIPLPPFGMPEMDDGERWDIASGYADSGWVDEDATFGKRVAGFFGFGKKKKAEGGSDEGKR